MTVPCPRRLRLASDHAFSPAAVPRIQFTHTILRVPNLRVRNLRVRNSIQNSMTDGEKVKFERMSEQRPGI